MYPRPADNTTTSTDSDFKAGQMEEWQREEEKNETRRGGET